MEVTNCQEELGKRDTINLFPGTSRSLLWYFEREEWGFGPNHQSPLYFVLWTYFEIALIVAIKTLRANLGLWTPLLPSYSNSK